MRTTALLLSLLFAAVANAAPTIRVFTQRALLKPGMEPQVFLQNESDEPAHDVVVAMEVPEGLELGHVNGTGLSIDGSEPVAWRCTFDERRGSCTADRFGPGATSLVSFTVHAASSQGGRFPMQASVTARELGTVATVDFTAITIHRIRVTSSGDFGAGTLRAAIEEVNADPRCGTDIPCHIYLGPLTIMPATPLPAIRKCNVRIEGDDTWELAHPVKHAALSGEKASHGNGLEVRAACAAGVDGVVINGLAIHSWPEHGVIFDTPAPHESADTVHVISRSYIGTDVTGMLARGNGMRGVATFSPHDVVAVSEGVVSANRLSGITLWSGRKISIAGLKIGTDREGRPLPNGGSGIASFGVPFSANFNTIAFNRHFGIALTGGTAEASLIWNTFRNNVGLPIDWGLDGRSLPDDEIDGIPNAPRILDTFFDPRSGRVIVRASVRVRPGVTPSFTVDAYVLDGEELKRIPSPSEARPLPTAGGVTDVTFEVPITADFRGRPVALQVHFGRQLTPVLSTEISETAVLP